MKKFNVKNSIFRKYLMQLVIFIGLPLIFIILAVFLLFDDSEQYSRYRLNLSVSEAITNNIKYNIEFTHKIKQTTFSNDDLIKFFTREYTPKKDYKKYKALMSYLNASINTDYRSDIRIYTSNESIPLGFGVIYHLSQIQNNNTIADFLSSDLTSNWYSASDFTTNYNPYFFTTNDCFIYLEKVYNISNQFLGIIVFSIPEKYFLSYESDNKGTVVSNSHYRIINLTNEPLSDSDIEKVTAVKKDYSSYGSYLLYRQADVDALFPFTIIVATKKSNTPLILNIFTVTLIILVTFSAYLFMKSVKHLVNKMNHCLMIMDDSISNNFLYRIPVEGNDEMTQIVKKINLLLDDTANLLKLSVLKETASKEAQLIALQHQINPHFIYNTMEVFSSKMKLYRHYEESDAMVAFANIFRYNISTKNEFVPVSEELKQAVNYIDIQKLRYPNLELSLKVPMEIKQKSIPRFIFQPLIENCITHGIERKDFPLKITIEAISHDTKNEICFYVKDNGLGIHKEELEELNSRLKDSAMNPILQSNGKSVGLSNLNVRLTLYYGSAYYIRINSTPNVETILYFSIPIHESSDVKIVNP